MSKNTSRLQQVKKRICTVFVAFTMLIGVILPECVYAEEPLDYNMEGMNNLLSAEGATLLKVSGRSASDTEANTSLRVVLTNEDDKVTLYKIADVTWDEEKGYSEPVWMEQVTKWIEAIPEYNDSVVYSTPIKLGTASNAKIATFYQDLLKNDGKVVDILELPEEVADPGEAEPDPEPQGDDTEKNPDKIYPYEYKIGEEDINTTYVTSQSSDENGAYVDFSKLSFGTYAIMAESAGGNKYNPTVVNLVPIHTGPWNSYYIQSQYITYLKESDATIEKEINGANKAVVTIGQEVSFDISIGMPTLYKDRITLSNDVSESSTVKPYAFYMEDVMSPAFVLENGIEDLTISYVDNEDNEVTLETVPKATYNEFATVDYEESGATILEVPEDGRVEEQPIYLDDVMNTELKGKKYITRSNVPIYTITESERENAYGTIDSVFRIEFNVTALKAWVKQQSFSSIKEFKISYDATVTEAIEVGNERNYNIASIFQEKNALGTVIGKIDSTVHAYTYGLHLLKRDGQKPLDDPTGYLEGALFNLFKEKYSYTPGVAEAAGTFTTVSGDVVARATLLELFPTAHIESGDTDKEINELFLNMFMADNTNYYVYHENESIYRIFELFTMEYTYSEDDFEGSFASVGNADGVLVKGLTGGSYVLVEEEPPLNYNELAEDLLFTIETLSDAEAEQKNNGSLSAFYEINTEGEKVYNETGVCALTVLNYKGIRLPSTGGMGTMLFTLVGILMMGSVMLIIVIKDQKKYEYM